MSTAGVEKSSAGKPAVLTVTCPECNGDGYLTHRVGLTSNPHATCDVATESCGTCRSRGELDVRPECDPRRLFVSGCGERYVETDHPPFWINADLYVLDGAGDTVLVESGDVDCSICGAVVEDGSTIPLCRKCQRTAKAHGRLENERRRQEAEAAA